MERLPGDVLEMVVGFMLPTQWCCEEIDVWSVHCHHITRRMWEGNRHNHLMFFLANEVERFLNVSKAIKTRLRSFRLDFYQWELHDVFLCECLRRIEKAGKYPEHLCQYFRATWESEEQRENMRRRALRDSRMLLASRSRRRRRWAAYDIVRDARLDPQSHIPLEIAWEHVNILKKNLPV